MPSRPARIGGGSSSPSPAASLQHQSPHAWELPVAVGAAVAVLGAIVLLLLFNSQVAESRRERERAVRAQLVSDAVAELAALEAQDETVATSFSVTAAATLTPTRGIVFVAASLPTSATTLSVTFTEVAPAAQTFSAYSVALAGLAVSGAACTFTLTTTTAGGAAFATGGSYTVAVAALSASGSTLATAGTVSVAFPTGQ